MVFSRFKFLPWLLLGLYKQGNGTFRALQACLWAGITLKNSLSNGNGGMYLVRLLRVQAGPLVH